MYMRSLEEGIGSSRAGVTNRSRPSLLMTRGNCSCALPEFGRRHSLDQIVDHEVLCKDHTQY